MIIGRHASFCKERGVYQNHMSQGEQLQEPAAEYAQAIPLMGSKIFFFVKCHLLYGESYNNIEIEAGHHHTSAFKQK